MKPSGAWTALATPFDKNGALDEKALRALVRLQLRSGASGLIPCGSTGEAATLSHEEYRRVIELTLAESQGELPVYAGVGTNDTAKAVALSREAQSLGADGILLLTPYYNKPTQEGLFRHFEAVARGTTLPIIAYNIPGRSAVNLLPDTLLRIHKRFPQVLAVKEAAGSVDQVSEILCKAPSAFTVLSGDDSLTLPMMSVGARGVVSVVSNIAPRSTAQLCAAALAGDWGKARALHLKLYPLIKALFVETNPIPVKAALELMGLCHGSPRLPLTPITPAAKAVLRREMKAFGLL